MEIWNWALFAFGMICLLVSFIMIFITVRLKERQKLAYKGNELAAKHLVLPSYMPLFYGFVCFFTAMFIVSTVLALLQRGNTFGRMVLIYAFSVVGCAFGVGPVLLTQKSISISSAKRVNHVITPWFVCSTVFWISMLCSGNAIAVLFLHVLFLIVTSVLPLCFCSLVYLHYISCRVVFKSASNRSSILNLLMFSISFLSFNILYLVYDGSEYVEALLLAATAFIFILLISFPITLYRTLLADTKFWRGLGKHNRGGFRSSTSAPDASVLDQVRNSFHDIPVEMLQTKRESEIAISTASNQFQNMMNDISDVMIDFAFIEIGPIIGHGASADVYCGNFQNHLVAIKVSAPPEITEEALDSFYTEASVTSALDHPNVIKFYGICVKPPEIGMVIEFCSKGNLKQSLVKNAKEWTDERRLVAALHASRAVEYVHSKDIIHRDIKADNFFVDKDWNIKLGDFGESVFRQRYSQGRRMTILGTVAFMAPELVEGCPEYTEAIDIYALGITFWEIWTGEDPFGDTSTFSVYSKISSGDRPSIPKNMPKAFAAIMCRAWHQDPSTRPSAAEIVQLLEAVVCLHNVREVHNSSVSEGDRDCGIELLSVSPNI